MTRIQPMTVLGCLLLAGLLAPLHAAEGEAFVHQPVAGSVHLLRSPGDRGDECNIVVSAGDDGVVMVDTCVAETAPQLLAAVRKISDRPVRFVIDTHVHGDHTGGNAFFQKLAPVIARGNVRKWLISGNTVTKDKPAPPEALPTITIEGETTLHLNGEDIRLLPLPPAHTDGDLAVFFEKAKVVAVGDVFMSPATAFGDPWYGSSMLKLIDALELLLPRIPEDVKVIPGHGVISTRGDVARCLDMLKQMKAVVERAIRDGKSEAQVIADRPFDKWRSAMPTWDSSDASLDFFVRNFYRQLKGG